MFLLTLLFLSHVSPSMEAYWWTVGNTKLQDMASHHLAVLHRFNSQQLSVVQNTPNLLQVVGRGAAMAIQECKRQFKYMRWNCSNYSSESVFGKVVNMACRETAFIYAITSASVTYSLTENCAKGYIKGCSCRSGAEKKKRSNNEWIYEGCHDNVWYGYKKGAIFCDAKETSNDFKAVVNLHNNEAGRLAVLHSMTRRCKCHGVSGNCNVKTCYDALALFGKIGHKLKESYNTATKVEPIQISGKRRYTRNHLKLSNRNLRPTKRDLVYFEDSPDFCVPNLSHGSLGTHGRYCNGSLRAKGVAGCEVLCCGRSWKTENVTRIENCRCVFKWCCAVECEKCKVTREFSYCE